MKGKILAGILLCSLVLTGCGKQEATTDLTQQQAAAQTVPAKEELFSDRDQESDYADQKQAHITLDGSSASCDSDAVQLADGRVTITDEGTYVLTGSLEGMVIVNAQKEDQVQLVLRNAHIGSPTSAAIYILQADKVFVTLEGENSLKNGGSFVAIDESSIDSVIFSREDLTLNGEGTLRVESPAGHGILSKDELTVTGGSYQLTTAGHGLDGKDSVCIADGSFTIAAGKDGIHAENSDDASLGYVYIENGSFTISAEGDGISAAAAMELRGGSYQITTGGGSENGEKQTSDHWGGFGGSMGGGRGPGGMSSMEATEETDSTSIKGLKAGGALTIVGGSYTINSADDGVHSNGDLTVTGGSFSIATGDDGFHADETLTVSAGTITVTESYEGLEGLHITISGGDITLTATDDGINAAGGTDSSGFGGNRGDTFGRPGGMGGMSAGNGSVLISGGNISVTASGDGIDANGSLEITGGYTVVTGPTQGDTATLDYDTTAVIRGGTFIGTGGGGMAQTFSGGEQGVISLSVGNCQAGTQVTLTDVQGRVLIDHTPEMSFAVVILSCPEMVSGESYGVTVGTTTKTFAAN